MASRRRDTLLAHTLVRLIADEYGIETVEEAQAVTGWQAAKLIPLASRVVTLIALWAVALEESGKDSIGIEEFVALNRGESRATSYRHMQDFRRAWPEYETPNELARLLLRSMRGRVSVVRAGSVAVAV